MAAADQTNQNPGVFVYQLQNLNSLLHHRLQAASAAHLPRHYPIALTHVYHCIGLLKEIQDMHNEIKQLTALHSKDREIPDYIAANLAHIKNVVDSAKKQDIGTAALAQQAQLMMPMVDKLTEVFNGYDRVFNPDKQAAYLEFLKEQKKK